MLTNVSLTDTVSKWETPLRQWFQVLQDYQRSQKERGHDDVAYWYNERATLSSIAGALWRSGHLVLEEYRTKRGGNGPEGGAGRTDLWCRIDSDEYTVEAKQDSKLSYPATAASLTSWALTQLSWASAQCSTDNFGGPNRIAMVFMVPSLREAPTADSLSEWHEAVLKFDADIKASYFNTPSPQSPNNNRFFPGVVLLGRVVPPQPSPRE